MGSGGGKAAVLAVWRESEEELRALATLPELAAYEWGDELKWRWWGQSMRAAVV